MPSCFLYNVTDESLNVVQETPYSQAILGVGDVVDVRVYDEKELSGLHQISSQGTIRMPLIGDVKIGGLDPQNAGGVIAAQYEKKYLRNPEVSIFVQQFNSRKIYLLGEIRTPGAYLYEENMSLIVAIAKAGGTTNLASANNTLISRNYKGKQERIIAKVSDITRGESPDVSIAPGDIIFVPQSVF